MFSYLRPHRRSPSTPTTPNHDQPQSWEPPSQLSTDFGNPYTRSREGNVQNSFPPAYSPPPSLPPITRVTSPGFEPSLDFKQEQEWRGSKDGLYQTTQKASRTNPKDSIIPDLSPHEKQQQRPNSAGTAEDMFSSGTRSFPSNEEQTFRRHNTQGPTLPFVTNLEGQNRPTGRRPNGVRLPTPPPQPTPIVTSPFEQTQHRSGKARLNLLNPMSLLARRRNSQNIPQLIPTPIQTTIKPAEKTFDPRIRGTIYHDFSAPKPRRNVSSNDIQGLESGIGSSRQTQTGHNGDEVLTSPDRDQSPWSGTVRTPNFTENFEDEQPPDKAVIGQRAANDFSDLVVPQPPFAQGIARISDQSKSDCVAKEKVNANKESPDPGLKTLPSRILEAQVKDPPISSSVQSSKRVSIDASQMPPKQTPSKHNSRSRVSIEGTIRDGGSNQQPKHMKSTSSRFSFDMVGAAKQEKVLEDRHRQKAREKGTEAKETDDDIDNEGEDDFNYDDMMDDDGLEEKIPGVNTDADDDDDYDEHSDTIQRHPFVPTAGFGFYQHPKSQIFAPDTPRSHDAATTPRDPDGNFIGFAVTNEVSQNKLSEKALSERSSENPQSDKLGGDIYADGLGYHRSHSTSKAGYETQLPSITEFRPRQPSQLYQTKTDEEDDLYFDDGLIDFLGEGEDGVDFDESVFDAIDTDEYGRPLNPLDVMSTLYLSSVDNGSRGAPIQNPSALSQPPLGALPPAEPFTPQISNTSALPTTLQSQSSDTTALPPSALTYRPSVTLGLTHDKLAAYQSALAAAARDAAVNGKFVRHKSLTSASPANREGTFFPTDTDHDDHDGDLDGDNTALVPDSGHQSSEFSRLEPFSPTYQPEDGGFDFSDALEDDPIIAAANAEALANDCDGFYGQEFGFYSAPASASSTSDVVYANGGYFGARGSDGLGRSHSGRIVGREPNLTPITERSEYSNRNSVMSMQQFPGSAGGGGGGGALNSPNLAQLAAAAAASAGKIGLWDAYGLSMGAAGVGDLDGSGDAAMQALLRARRGAWGGSQASAHSSREESPDSGNSPMGVGVPPWGGYAGWNHARKGSAFSLASEGLLAGVDEEVHEEREEHDVYGGESEHLAFRKQAAAQAYPSADDAAVMSPALSTAAASLPQQQPAPYRNHSLTQISIRSPQSTSSPVSAGIEISPALSRARKPSNSTASGTSSPHIQHSSSSNHNPKAQNISVSPPSVGDRKEAAALTLSPASLASSGSVMSGNDGGRGPGSAPDSSQTRPAQRPAMTPRKHRQTGSADSISYTKEGDPVMGGERWVLERRRTGEDGGVEILAREVVEGGRI